MNDDNKKLTELRDRIRADYEELTKLREEVNDLKDDEIPIGSSWHLFEMCQKISECVSIMRGVDGWLS